MLVVLEWILSLKPRKWLCCVCRGENGELRLGIRRAVRPRNGLPDSIVGNQNSCADDLARVVKAISTKSTFDVFYNPRYHHGSVVFIVNHEREFALHQETLCLGGFLHFRCLTLAVGDELEMKTQICRSLSIFFLKNVEVCKLVLRVNPWQLINVP